jgi:hypothetical protein
LPPIETSKFKLPKINNSISNLDTTADNKNKNLNSVLTESRKVLNKMKMEKIEYDNAKFANRIHGVKSPFNRGKLDDEYKKSREYLKLANRLKSKSELSSITVKKLHLPKFVLQGLGHDIKRLLN